MNLFRRINTGVLFFLVCLVTNLHAQTDTIQTFTFSNPARSGVFVFPNDPTKTYEQIKMLYRMRCKNGLVSTANNRNLGCGEWDYSCNTYITDSAKIDSVKATHPNYLISGFSGNNFSYSNLPTFEYFRYNLISTSPGSGTDTINTLVTGNNSTAIPFATQTLQAKSQFLYTATELSAAGVSAGQINGIQLTVNQIGNTAQFLKIRIKKTQLSAINQIEDTTGMLTVYFNKTDFETAGPKNFRFFQPFVWDGMSSVIVEISFCNTTPSGVSLAGGAPAFPASLINLVNDHFLDLDGTNGHINCGDIDALDGASKLTFEGWVYIKSWQNWSGIFKDNGKTILETGDNQGQLYCIIRNPNNSYGYANNVLPLRKWTHVAMVYDGTQPSNVTRLKLYVNGVQKTLTFSGSIPSTTETNTTPVEIGRGVHCKIDDPRIWSDALPVATVKEWMTRRISGLHPNYAALQAGYLVDDASGNSLADVSLFGRNGQAKGNFQWGVHRGNDVFKNLETGNGRPSVGWIRNRNAGTNTSIAVLDSVVKLPNVAIAYTLQNGQPVPVDTTSYFAASPQEVYNESGTLVQTINPAINGTITISDLNYFQQTPQKVELMSFVTPYGIGLNFGQEGKVWEFDVTDYLHVLKGPKRLSMERGGENQEDIDIKFVFIEGTPVRPVLSLTQIWPVSHVGYADILANKTYEPRTLAMQPNASTFKMKSVVTGHGQEGEFIARNHFVNINGGASEFQWQAWTECSLNPIFPQGGTWVYDRAGWCPGAPSDINEWNATAHLQAGQNAVFDYGVTAGSGDTRYIASHQLVQYGPTSFQLDAAISRVIAPGNATEHSRKNPACMNPTVRIQNTGSTTLTSLTLSFGLENSNLQTFEWSGSLPFLGTEDVILPVANMGVVPGTFVVTCSAPNGGIDAYPANNTIRSTYAAPFVLPARFIVELRSNAAPDENEYQILNAEGSLVHGQTNLTANTLYRDTLELPEGCYEFSLIDGGSDGLSWWANTAQGNGSLRFRNATTGATIRTVNPDFGSEAYLQFYVSGPTEARQPVGSALEIQLFPNPAEDVLQADVAALKGAVVMLTVCDAMGREMLQQKADASGLTQISVKALAPGTYFLKVSDGQNQQIKKFIK